MPTLLLIRHNENDWHMKIKLPGHLPGIHPNQRGFKKPAARGGILSLLSIETIYSSLLERAVETAALLVYILSFKYLDPLAIADSNI
jgi:broad specificity phosphatase PhoE